MRNVQKDEIEMAARRESVLENGFRLFSEIGIGQLSMQQISDAYGIGIATLYRYFSNKLALVIAIGTRKWEEFGEYVENKRAESGALTLNAAEELELYLDCYIDLYRDHKDLLRFNQDFNNYVRHEGATPEQLKSYLEAIGTFAYMFHSVYQKGLRDKTIFTELSEEKMFAATSHIMLAVAVRYAQGLLWAAGSEADRTEEYLLLKKMLLREFTV